MKKAEWVTVNDRVTLIMPPEEETVRMCGCGPTAVHCVWLHGLGLAVILLPRGLQQVWNEMFMFIFTSRSRVSSRRNARRYYLFMCRLKMKRGSLWCLLLGRLIKHLGTIWRIWGRTDQWELSPSSPKTHTDAVMDLFISPVCVWGGGRLCSRAFRINITHHYQSAFFSS